MKCQTPDSKILIVRTQNGLIFEILNATFDFLLKSLWKIDFTLIRDNIFLVSANSPKLSIYPWKIASVFNDNFFGFRGWGTFRSSPFPTPLKMRLKLQLFFGFVKNFVHVPKNTILEFLHFPRNLKFSVLLGFQLVLTDWQISYFQKYRWYLSNPNPKAKFYKPRNVVRFL